MEPEIDVEKLTFSTKWRLMQFAEALENQEHNTISVDKQIHEFTNEFMTYESCPNDIAMKALLCREALQLCHEPEIKTLVDQIDVSKILDRLQNKATSEKYTAAYHEMKRIEKQLTELGWKCKNHIGNSK